MRTVMGSRAWLGLFLVGCAGTTHVAEAPVESRSVAVEAVAPSAQVEVARRNSGPMTRSEVDALVARGLGTVLARVQVSPVLDGSHFVGFRLDAAQDLADWHAAGADVRLGDVIVRINGIRIERPEQALWAFERLRIATAIEVDLLRAGVATTVRSPILDPISHPSDS